MSGSARQPTRACPRAHECDDRVAGKIDSDWTQAHTKNWPGSIRWSTPQMPAAAKARS